MNYFFKRPERGFKMFNHVPDRFSDLFFAFFKPFFVSNQTFFFFRGQFRSAGAPPQQLHAEPQQITTYSPEEITVPISWKSLPYALLGGHFGPEKTYLAHPAPPNLPIRCTHPPGPSAPPVLETPPPPRLFSIKNRSPSPLPAPQTPPSPSPSRKKKRNVHQV